MQTEIEAKFLDIDHDAMRVKLQELGATRKQPMRLIRRKNYDFPDRRLEKIGGWVRVRDEGDKVTMSYKQLNDRSLHGTKEVSVVVDDFDQACQLLEAIGLVANSYQESKRESWERNGTQIELDEWPWTKPYMEVEGPGETAVRDTARRIGLDWSKAVHGSVEINYITEYDVTETEVDSWEKLTFSPVPDWLEAKRNRADT